MLYASKTCDTTAWKSYPSKKEQDLVFENTKRSEIQPSCKKSAALKSLGKKSCEIKGGSQEMAAVMSMLKKI